jgi:hypothetical protein
VTDDADPNPWADYESGPYCRHWSEWGDCSRVCTACQHPCNDHQDGTCDGICDGIGYIGVLKGCPCLDFQPHACNYGCPKDKVSADTTDS